MSSPTEPIITVFDYIPELDCFTVNKEYQKLTDRLGISEWNPVVWIGRYFTSDNDYGEHWFDNWDERSALEGRAKQLGYGPEDLYIINPDQRQFQNGDDGPCHSSEQRKQFWTDVLKSLKLSFNMLFGEARYAQKLLQESLPAEELHQDSDYREDLERVIENIKRNYRVEERQA